MVVDTVRDLAWTLGARTGVRKLTAEGLYGRPKVTALARRRRLPEASARSLDRAMRLLGPSGVRQDKGEPS
jgi:putative transposase